VLGAFLDNLTRNVRFAKRRDPRLLTARQFDREVTRERIRSTRRSIPFCLVTIDVVGKLDRSGSRAMVRVLHRHLRMTDQKSQLSPTRFAVLLVDTSELGGRSVLDRLRELMIRNRLAVSMNLRVHDPDGFGSEEDDEGVGGRRSSDVNPRRFDNAGHEEAQPLGAWSKLSESNVEVTNEDPMVNMPAATLALKRATDIVGACVGLTFGGPLILASMLAIKLNSPGPAIFKQTREGRRGRPFTIYKLRTMVVDAESSQAELKTKSHRDGPAFKIKSDPRVTTVGRVLRATCIDELPQLWNVLRGDMSLVGPRPLPWHESRACDRWHRRRLDLRPGMTCYWQVDKAKATTFDEWMRMDLRYIDQFGLFEDIGLLAQTIVVPMTGRGSD
jgi:lipopolysaccharide/colanic/teichoic acid biosynthesis glycosyltransferase